MRKKKICVITGSRAEYGLLYWFMRRVNEDICLRLQLVVTGMHLSKKFGLTYKEIEKEFKINKKININISTDTSANISNSISKSIELFSDAYIELKPDLIVVLGDRYEIFSATVAAMIYQIPIAHIHGGELSEGSWDDSIRHCITKMSQFHFTATMEYSKRVVQLGEDPKRVFCIGGTGIENIKRLKLLNKKEFENSINFKLNKKNLLVAFHSSTLEKNTSKKQFQELLFAIDELEDTNIIFTKTNSDLNGHVINQMIDDYTIKNSNKSVSFVSLGQLRYLSALKFVDALIGNSSSGLIEAPSFKIASVNIGDRQKGRIKAESVINCLPRKKDIKDSINKVYSVDFQKLLKSVINPYDKGNSSKKIVNILKKINLENILKKKFYDIEFKL